MAWLKHHCGRSLPLAQYCETSGKGFGKGWPNPERATLPRKWQCILQSILFVCRGAEALFSVITPFQSTNSWAFPCRRVRPMVFQINQLDEGASSYQCCKKTGIHLQGGSLSKQWTEGRDMVNPLELPTLKGGTAERKKILLCL